MQVSVPWTSGLFSTVTRWFMSPLNDEQHSDDRRFAFNANFSDLLLLCWSVPFANTTAHAVMHLKRRVRSLFTFVHVQGIKMCRLSFGPQILHTRFSFVRYDSSLQETDEHGIIALGRPAFCVWSPCLVTVGFPLKAMATTTATSNSHSISKMLHPNDSLCACDGPVISPSPWVQSTPWPTFVRC